MYYRPFKKIVPERLEELLAQGLQSHELAAEFQCSGACISQYLRKHNLKANPRTRKNRTCWSTERDKLRKYVADGLKPKDIAKLYAVSYNTIVGVLNRIKIEDGHVPTPRGPLKDKRTPPESSGSRWTDAALTETWEQRKARRARERAALTAKTRPAGGADRV